MYGELIAIVIFIVSCLGLFFIILKKIPRLLELPEMLSVARVEDEKFFSEIGKNIKNFPVFKDFSFNVFLQKTLSRMRILVLKIDNKTFNWLQRLREKSQKKKFGENENYWKDIRDSDKDKRE